MQDFVQRCYDAGDIYKSSYSGLYCPACEAYYTEENLVDGLCPDHGTAPVRMDEDNYFFRLSAFQDRLAAHYRSHPDFVRPRHRYNEALSFIEQGLDDISISRATLKWGISVPWDETQVIYVWVDALINYLSALHYAPGQDLVSRFWPASYHLMAQDILKFHGIIWPALLMSAGYELPEHLFIHGYLKLGGEKMSKTRGNVMDPFPLIEQYGADPFRFYCLREVSFGQDGMVSEEGLQGPLQQRVGQRTGQPGVADHLDDRQVPGRRRPGAAPRTRDAPERTWLAGSPLAAEAVRLRHRADATRGHGPERRPGDRSGSSCAGSTATSKSRRPGSRPRRPRPKRPARRRQAAARARRHALGPGRGPAPAVGAAASVHPRRPPRPSANGWGLAQAHRGPAAPAGCGREAGVPAGAAREALLPTRAGTRPAGVCFPRRPMVTPAPRSSRASRTELAPRSRRAVFIDSHTHLDHCKEDPASLVDDAWQAGVGLIIQSGIDLSASRQR